MINTLKTACCIMLCAALAAHAQDFGDTPYVQTPQNVVDKMLEVAHVTAADYVIDLGSGDGRMVITAAKKYGARGFGVDLDQRLVKLSNKRAAQAGVADRAKFYAQDLYEADLSAATVMTIYLLPEVNLMVRPKLLATLKPGTRIVSHDYGMGDWEPDQSFVMDAPDKPVGRDKKSKVYYWVVPAAAAGKWRWRLDEDGAAHHFELELDQKFQHLRGTLETEGVRVPLTDAQLTGDRIHFSATFATGGKPVRYAYTGRIVNNAMEGTVEVAGGAKKPWGAARTEVWPPEHLTAPSPAPTEIPK